MAEADGTQSADAGRAEFRSQADACTAEDFRPSGVALISRAAGELRRGWVDDFQKLAVAAGERRSSRGVAAASVV